MARVTKKVHAMSAFITRLRFVMALGFATLVSFGAQAIDHILVNGKIITVDSQFAIVPALAIEAGRIVATGSNAKIRALAGPQTSVIDLKGKTVIPGLIDNHAHWIRAAEHNELRFDGVVSRAKAWQMLVDRVKQVKAGQWVVVLGGWSEQQFLDSTRGFSLKELDQLAPQIPVVIQAIYNHSYLNTAALKASGIDANTPNPPNGVIEKDALGQPTGLVSGAGGVAFVAAKIPLFPETEWLANTEALTHYLNSIGITAWLDAGGRGMGDQHYTPFKLLAERGQLPVRAFWTVIRQPSTAKQVDGVLEEIERLKPFQGNDFFNNLGWGETLFAPVTSQLLRPQKSFGEEGILQMTRVASALARRGIFANSHVEMNGPIDQFLTAYESVNAVTPIRTLRWAFSHLDQVDEKQLERMKRLGMTAMIHSRPLIQGALMHEAHGNLAWDMPPFRKVQDSGIMWGLGSDATAVTTSNPFYTLSFAVTGKMIGGRHVNRQSISRDEALIAHTRSNAFILFQEANLGSLAPGKYADLLVLDRDYLTVPIDQIQLIKPLMTMVGGKIVYQR